MYVLTGRQTVSQTDAQTDFGLFCTQTLQVTISKSKGTAMIVERGAECPL